MEPLHLFAGLAFDPHIRGILIVVASSSILMGSIYLILATNTGARLGLLIASAGFFGWMAIMGVIWWIYGIGLIGSGPAWHVVEVNVAAPNDAQTSVARSLPRYEELPTASELLEAHPSTFSADEFETTDTLSDLAVAPGACTLFGGMDFGGWKLASLAELGEPQAVVDPVMIDAGYFETASQYKVLNGFSQGGKKPLAECAEESITRIDRITHFVTSLSPTHPSHYFVLQVQPVITQEARPGEAPPRPVVDPTKPVLNVVMVRDLGDLRYPPAMITLASLLIFMVLVSMLNRRDRVLEKHLREAP